MTAEESFNQWVQTHELYDLPWQIDRKVLHGAFMAGWEAFRESLSRSEKDNAALASVLDAATITAEDIYKAYPRKVGKAGAIKAIEKAAKELNKHGPLDGHDNGLSYLLDRTQAYAAAVAQWPAADKQFVPHPATWFNRGSYDDETSEWIRGTPKESQFSKEYR